MAYDSRIDTYKHIAVVRGFILRVIQNLQSRSEAHDLSKLDSPEKEVFDEFTPKLAGSTYGSEEYKSFLAAMKPALDHHYAANDHHPEHHQAPEDHLLERLRAARDTIEFGHTGQWATDAVMVMDADLQSRRSPIRGMNLISLLEMLCDWKAATLRHNDGDILKSIEINQRRFGYSDELKQILLNTVAELGLE